jgi:EasF-like predicted methyltransferase
LNALEKAEKEVEYYALDLSLVELQRTLEAISTEKYHHVKCRGLHGTYDDGLEWLKSDHHASRPKAVLSMGSSIGNFRKSDATGFLKSFASILQPGDCMIIGIDACKDPRKVFHAYNDIEGTTHQFILNGLEHANNLLGSKEFNIKDWKVIGEYRYGEEGGRHMAFVSPICDVTIDGVSIRKGERIQIEESNKFSADEANQLFREAGLVQGVRWANQQGDYGM